MNCPKCDSKNVESSIKKGRIIKKRLPLWVGVISIIGSFFVIPICSIEQIELYIKVTLAIICMIGMYGGIIYLIVRGVRISKEKEIMVIETKCKSCGYEFIEKLE